MKKTIFAALLAAVLLVGCAATPASTAASVETLPPSTGQIYLYGEEHSNADILQKELELWQGYYNEQGMRHLFVEYPYYSAELLNQWMQAEDDAIMENLYADLAGTAVQTEATKNFWLQIKQTCPETVFHGTDVGHQSETTGKRYLQSLGDDPAYAQQRQYAEQIVAQGEQYYATEDDAYRENMMAENFIRAFDALGGESVMGIYGSAHTNPTVTLEDGVTPVMASQLFQRYGEALHSEDLYLQTLQSVQRTEPERMDTLTVAGKQYQAAYFGSVDRSAQGGGILALDFWRLEDAGTDFDALPATGDILPYYNYPCPVAEGDVFVIEITMTDGSVSQLYHRAAGGSFSGNSATEGFDPDA